MTPIDFGYWLRGICGDFGATAIPLGDVAAQVLKKALEVQGKLPTAAPPAMRPLNVPMFCIHNVHVQEVCASCRRLFPAGNERVFGFGLPAGMKQVYIPVDNPKERSDAERVREPDGHGGAGIDHGAKERREAGDGRRTEGGT